MAELRKFIFVLWARPNPGRPGRQQPPGAGWLATLRIRDRRALASLEIKPPVGRKVRDAAEDIERVQLIVVAEGIAAEKAVLLRHAVSVTRWSIRVVNW